MGVEGLIHVSTMVNDYYSYVEEQYAMVGERTQAKYRLGDTVTILLVRANVEERNLDFVLKDNGAYDPTAMKNAVRGGRSANKSGKKDNNRDKKDAGNRGGRRGDAQKKQPTESELIAEPMTTNRQPHNRPESGIVVAASIAVLRVRNCQQRRLRQRCSCCDWRRAAQGRGQPETIRQAVHQGAVSV